MHPSERDVRLLPVRPCALSTSSAFPTELPRELQQALLSHLGLAEYLALRLVSRSWNKMMFNANIGLVLPPRCVFAMSEENSSCRRSVINRLTRVICALFTRHEGSVRARALPKAQPLSACFSGVTSLDFNAGNACLADISRAADLRVLAQLGNLRNLRLPNGYDITIPSVQALEPISGLTFISLGRVRLDGRAVQIREMRWLHSIVMHMDASLVSDTTPEAIAALSMLSRLQTLRLDALFLPDHPGKALEACLAKAISGLQSLQSLHLKWRVTGPHSLAAIGGLSALESLQLASYGPSIGDSGYSHVASMASSLRKLRLSHDMPAAFLQLLPALTCLRILHVRGCPDAAAASLATLTGLKDLSLQYSTLSDATLALLARSLRRLVRLDLRGCGELSSSAMGPLLAMHQLEALDLHFKGGTGVGGGIPGAQLGRLAALTRLRALAVNREMGDEAMAALAGPLTALTQLDISWSQVTNVGLVSVAQLKNLRQLNAERCRHITLSGLCALTALASLQMLDVRGIPQLRAGAGLLSASTSQTGGTALCIEEFLIAALPQVKLQA